MVRRKENSREDRTETLYCRGVKPVNKRFAMRAHKRLKYSSTAEYVDALLDDERTRFNKKKQNAKNKTV